MFNLDGSHEVKEKTKITALKWCELTEAEKGLVIGKNATNPHNFKGFVYLMENSICYYFDRLGNIYVHDPIL